MLQHAINQSTIAKAEYWALYNKKFRKLKLFPASRKCVLAVRPLDRRLPLSFELYSLHSTSIVIAHRVPSLKCIFIIVNTACNHHV